MRAPHLYLIAWFVAAFVLVFPCGQVGGAEYIHALRGPLPQVPLIPTGGVNVTTAADFILAGAAALGVGGELVQPEALNFGRVDIITENARRFVSVVSDARSRLLHPHKAAAASIG